MSTTAEPDLVPASSIDWGPDLLDPGAVMMAFVVRFGEDAVLRLLADVCERIRLERAAREVCA